MELQLTSFHIIFEQRDYARDSDDASSDSESSSSSGWWSGPDELEISGND